MIETIGLLGFFTLGLLGGFGHCIGMCSPFVLFVSRRYVPPDAGRGGAIDGAAALALFGLGTAPALLGISLADELLARHRAFLNRLSQLFILAMGAWFLWSGLAG